MKMPKIKKYHTLTHWAKEVPVKDIMVNKPNILKNTGFQISSEANVKFGYAMQIPKNYCYLFL